MLTRSNGRATAGPPTAPFTRRRRGRQLLALGTAVLIGSLIGIGGAGAVGLLTGKNIRDDSLRSRDFHDNSVRAARFRDGSLRQADVSFDLTGDPGPIGNPGPPGLPGIQSLTYRTGPIVSDNAAGAITVTAACHEGEIAISGGAQRNAAPAGPDTTRIANIGEQALGSAWSTRIAKDPGAFAQYTPVVVCARVP